MKFIKLDIPDVILIEPDIKLDERGYSTEIFNIREMKKNGIPISYKQIYQTGSYKGTLRGLHYEVNQPRGKLINVISGTILDVCVDLRQSSPTFRKYVSNELSSKDKKQIWIPGGFSHGFYVLSDYAEIIYHITHYNVTKWIRTLLWNDKDIGIKWPTDNPLFMSERDRNGTPFNKLEL